MIIFRLFVLVLSLIKEGKLSCQRDDYLFQGRAKGNPISLRTANLVFQRSAQRAGLASRYSCMTLRHSYAVHALQSGVNIREVQMTLGHQLLSSTMIYLKCILPGQVGNQYHTNNLANPVTDPLTELYQDRELTRNFVTLPFKPKTSQRSASYYTNLRIKIGHHHNPLWKPPPEAITR